MKSMLALSTLIVGAALLPAASFAGNQQEPQATTQDTQTVTRDTQTVTTETSAAPMASTDSSIASKINSQLVSEHISGITVAADASGVVSLTGSATTQADVDKAATIAHNTAGVTAINNSVTVKSTQ